MGKKIKKSSSVLASNSRCISAEAVPKKKIRKRKGRSDASDTDVETKQEKEPRCRKTELTHRLWHGDANP
nr:hypothetical protein [Tanacetum cinerariifolium]